MATANSDAKPSIVIDMSLTCSTYDSDRSGRSDASLDSDEYSEDAEEFDCDEHLGDYPDPAHDCDSPIDFQPSLGSDRALADLPLPAPFAANPDLYHALLRAADVRFGSLGLEAQIELFESLEMRSYVAGEVVVAEGAQSRDMFFIVGTSAGNALSDSAGSGLYADGEVEVLTGDRVVTRLKVGQHFGERFFMVRRPVKRNATVRVPLTARLSVNLAVLKVDRFDRWDAFRHFMLLRKVPIFATLRLPERVSLFGHVLMREFEDGALILVQGARGAEFFVVLEGSVRIVETSTITPIAPMAPTTPIAPIAPINKVLVTLHSGHFFGEMALLTSAPRVASAIAQGRTLCMCLDKDLFRAALSNEVFNNLLSRVVADRNLARSLRRNTYGPAAARKTRSASALPSPSRVSLKRPYGSSAELSAGMSQRKRVRAAHGARRLEHGIGGEYIGRYRVVRTLGRGTQGKVVLCEDEAEGGGGLVAVKIIPFPRARPGLAKSAACEYSATREAEIMRALSHKNVVRLIDVLEDVSSERTCLVLEYLPDALVKDGDERKAMSEEACWKLFRDLVEGVAYLHARGIVHRDIKPSNLLLGAEGCLKVSDFGLAAYVSDTDAVRGGTPAFMAPELFDSAQSFVSCACDVFAMGATLFCLLTGRPPWSGANQFLLAGNLTMFELTFPPEVEPVNPHLRHLLQRMMDKNPLERISIADIVAHDWVTAEGTQPLLGCDDG